MIQLKNLSFSYENNRILDKLTLEIEAYKTTCILGSSGCGKTTILRLIAGLETPLQGSVFIADNLVSKDGEILLPPHQRKIGYIFQNLALWPHFNVYKNIAFGLRETKNLTDNEVKNQVQEMLQFFNLEKEVHKYPHQLSGGQKQLLAIARAMVLKPKILLMDEPLSNLDVKLKRSILEYIKKLKQSFKISIVYVTHDHREAFKIADTVVVLNDGKIEDIGSVNQIKKSYNKFVQYFLEY